MHEPLNLDYKLRDQIVFDKEIDWVKEDKSGGTVSFPQLSIQKLNELKDLNFLELSECTNESPTIEEFMTFLTKWDSTYKIYAHGYAVSPNRGDYRITIAGITAESISEDFSKEFRTEFVNLLRFADDFTLNDRVAFVWYD